MMNKIIFFKNIDKFISNFLLIVSIFFYILHSIPQNLTDDHGIIITASLQASQGSLPGIDFIYPHGILSPILLGLLIKIFSIFGIGWQNAYFLFSIIIFISLIFTLRNLFNNLYGLNFNNALTLSTIISSAMLFPWGGFHFDYLSIIISLKLINILYLCLSQIDKANKFSKNVLISKDFIFIGLLSFINPFFIKLTSAYVSLVIGFLLILSIFSASFNKKLKLKLFKDYLFGVSLFPIIILIFGFFNLTKIKQILYFSYSPLLFAEDLGQYNFFSLPSTFFETIYITSIFSFLIVLLITKVIKKENLKFSDNKLICKFALFFFLYQFGLVWARDKNWVFLIMSFVLFDLFLRHNKELFKFKFNLLNIFTIILSFLNLGFYFFISSHSQRNKLVNAKFTLDLSGTKASLFKVKQGMDWGVHKDILKTSKVLNQLLDSRKIISYSFLDDNAFLIPLLTGKAPLQPFAFYQNNKTFFNKVPINPLIYNLGKPDALVLCKLPPLEKKEKNNIDSQLNNSEMLELFDYELDNKEINQQHSRFIRIFGDNEEYLKAKKIYSDLSLIYRKNYFIYYVNDSCIILTKKNLI